MTATGRVLHVQYANPGAYPPVIHAMDLLASAGYDVHVVGIAAAADPMTMPARRGLSVKMLAPCRRGWRQKAHYARFLAVAVLEARRFRPSWIYASDPLSCPAAAVLSLVTGAALIYHEHDSPEPPARTDSRFMLMVQRARRWCARRAALCIIPSERRIETFNGGTGRSDATIVWNVPAVEEAAQMGGSDPHTFRLLYHGSVAPERLPLAVIDALALLPERVTLSVVGYATPGHPEYLITLASRAEALGVRHRVLLAGTMSRTGALAYARTCDVGLSLTPRELADVNFRGAAMIGASNKVFDYMACGLPVLVTDHPAWHESYVAPGFARACDPDSAEGIAAALRWFIDHPADTRRMGASARDRILTSWNYERMFAPVMAAMRTRSASSADARSPVPGTP